MAVPRLYFFEPLTDEEVVPWLEVDQSGEYVAELKGISNPFRAFDRANTLAEADAAIVPNNFRRGTPEQQAAISRCADAAEKAGKKLFIFSCGDLTDTLRFDPRAYVFRYSTYRHTLQSQDIVAPTLTEDNLVGEVLIRPKQILPTISFCGQAGYKTKKQWLKYYLKVLAYRIASFVQPALLARTIGVYWRRVAIAACNGSALIETNFIIRRSFSAAQRTIELDPEQAKREFIASIVDTDFVLAPKGDGNYSNRFLEALSFGRIPVLIDTDYTSPLEDEIDYSSYIVRIPMNDVRHLPEYVRAWYDPLTQEEWETRQKAARALFETRLRYDAFYTHFFTEVLPNLPIIPQARKQH